MRKAEMIGLLVIAAGVMTHGHAHAQSQALIALPDQTSAIRLSNRDINHLICVGGEIEDVKFSAEKGISIERSGADAWVKFLVREIDDNGAITRTYPSAATEFFVSCNGAIYPLYSEPSDIPAQTIMLTPGANQKARINYELLGPLVEEERAVSISLSLLQDKVPASFSPVATRQGKIMLATLPDVVLNQRKQFQIDGQGLSASEYLVEAGHAVRIEERHFLTSELGSAIFAVTLDRLDLKAGETARLIIVKREIEP